ncbi:MAG: non-canonical purine NTP pyrophosphatase, partial [Chloroflexi bacterium]|nr:non-canonical purine NTP pyrophosphatase [Chloroflexota bacterium]
MPEQTLLIATHNAGKMREYAEIFAGLRLRLMSLAEAGIGWPAEETGATFEENARLKAAAYCAASGLLTLADDSGLEVDALNGEPGVQSARYAGASATFAERIRLLLARLNGVPPSRRRARFRCV